MGKPASFEKLVRKAREAKEAESAEARDRGGESYRERQDRLAREIRARDERASVASGMLWEDVERVVNSLHIANVLPKTMISDPSNLPTKAFPFTVREVYTGDSRRAKRRDEATMKASRSESMSRMKAVDALPKIPSWATHQNVALGVSFEGCHAEGGHLVERPLYIGIDRNVYFASDALGQLILRDELQLPWMAKHGDVITASDADLDKNLIFKLTAESLRTALVDFVVNTDLPLCDATPVQAPATA
jgi:hypothetical protein